MGDRLLLTYHTHVRIHVPDINRASVVKNVTNLTESAKFYAKNDLISIMYNIEYLQIIL